MQKLSDKKITITGYRKFRKETIFNKFYNIYKRIYIKLYNSILITSICVFVVSISYAIQDNINKNNMAKYAKMLTNNFEISRLYSNNNSNVKKVVLDNPTSNFSVIGLIRIDKIKISYSILSNINDDLLKISPCRFYGPMPNEIGNLCIAGHNYDDNRFFSKIKKLENNDIIEIYDINRKSKEL